MTSSVNSHALFHRDTTPSIHVPTPLAASPWNPDMLHGGAPAGLLCHLLEQHAPAGKQLCRVATDLLRPVPRQPLQTRVQVLRDGARLSLHVAELWHNDKLVARATGTWVKPHPVQLPAYAPQSCRMLPAPAFVETTDFSIIFGKKDIVIPPGLHTHMLIKPITPPLEQGSGRWWMTVPLEIVAGEPVTPITRVGLLSDFCNGVGQLNLGGNVGMINADITLQLHRIPEGEWIGLDGVGLVQPNGIGTTHCRLFDEEGEVGFVMQTVMPQAEFGGA